MFPLLSISVVDLTLHLKFQIVCRQYGPTFCQAKSCSSPAVSKFTIHGLWPDSDNGRYPADCNPSNQFSTNNLSQDLLNQLSCEWVSYTGSNYGFWSHEWSKHGTCATSIFPSQQEYFSAAVKLNNNYEPNNALSKAGIDVSKISSINPSQVQDILQNAWGVRPLVSCNKKSVSRSLNVSNANNNSIDLNV